MCRPQAHQKVRCETPAFAAAPFGTATSKVRDPAHPAACNGSWASWHLRVVRIQIAGTEVAQTGDLFDDAVALRLKFVKLSVFHGWSPVVVIGYSDDNIILSDSRDTLSLQRILLTILKNLTCTHTNSFI